MRLCARGERERTHRRRILPASLPASLDPWPRSKASPSSLFSSSSSPIPTLGAAPGRRACVQGVTDGFATSGWSLPTTRKLAKLMDTPPLCGYVCVRLLHCHCVGGVERAAHIHLRGPRSRLPARGLRPGRWHTIHYDCITITCCVQSAVYPSLSALSLALSLCVPLNREGRL